MNFTSLKSNCPICSGARRQRDCRQNTQTNLIHCRHDADSPPGFRFVGVDSIGFNMWAADDGRERDSSQWERERRQQAAERERRLAAEAERYKQLLNADERDQNIRKIHAQLGLGSRHRQHLKDRGLTDAQIDAGKFFSITPWQEVTNINSRLAGVDLFGQKLLIGQAGFACPVTDVQGRLIGWQTRFDNTTDNKYKWPTSQSGKRPNGATAHLQSGEMPLGCYRPVDGVKLDSIGLAEGFLKPFITAQRRGQIVIGAAGGNFASSPQQFKSYLDELAAELNTQTIDLYPDAGAIANKNVMRQYERALRLLDEWDYTARIAWWGQWTKEQPDIDELPSFEGISYLSPQEFLKLAVREQNIAHNFTGLLGWLPRMQSWLQKKSPWGFGKVEPTQPAAPPPALEYGQGDRLRFWQESYRQGHRHILDNSVPGTGKSFDAGLLTPEMLEAQQIIYISADHRNPTTSTLEGWQDLEARHRGLYRDQFGRLRRVDANQHPAVAPNCGRNQTIAALRSKNISGADNAELVCTTCPHFEPCRGGAVFGFLHERAIALGQSRLRAHPDSLPSPDSFDYSNVVLVWEEASQIAKAHRSIEVKDADVSRAIADLATKSPDTFDTLRPLLTALRHYTSGEIKQPNKYGWGDAQVRQALPELGDIDVEAIRATLAPNPIPIINVTLEDGEDAANLPRSVRKMLTPSDKWMAEKITSELALSWLPSFLDVLTGKAIGSLRIQYGTVTVTLGDPRLALIAREARCNIYLDATATVEDVTRPLRIDEPVLVAKQSIPENNNLEVIQVPDVGRLGLSQRSEYCQKRVDAVINQIKQEANGDIVTIDFKRHSEDGDGKRHWWVDSRGVNDLETCQTLILVGTPCSNLGALAAEFTVLHERSPQEDMSADPEFSNFVRRRILAEYHQAIGRLRSHRRPGESLTVYIIADYPLDFPATQVRASEITPEAASKVERFELSLLAAIQQLKDAGQKVTQSALAAVTGYSQQYISKFRNLLLLLLDGPYSKSSKNGESPPDPDETDWMSRKYLPLLAESPPDEMLKGVLEVFNVYGWAVFRAIWDAAPARSQLKILETLWLTLPANQLHSLARLV